MKNKEFVIYVPSYTLAHGCPSRLTYASLGTAKKGIEIMKEKRGGKIIFSTAYNWWKEEAVLKKKMAKEEGVADDLVEIIPAVTDSYDEAEKLSRIVNDPGSVVVLVAQKYHARRAAMVLRHFFKRVEVVKVSTRMERQLDPSWLKSVLGSSRPVFILWNWFFLFINPIMTRRQRIKG